MSRNAAWGLAHCRSLLLAITVGLAVSAAGCGGDSGSSGGGGEASGADQSSGSLSGTLTVVTWGGEYTKATKEFFADPFSKETGVQTKLVDAPGQMVAKLQAQANANQVTWDVIDMGEGDAASLAADGLLQRLPADLKQQLVETVGADNVTDYGISISAYSDVFACNPAVVKKCPKNAEEFWDTEGFPGRRAMYADGWSENLSYALAADGAPKEELSEPDVDRAFSSLDRIKPHINVWWTTGDQSQQIFRDKEVGMAIMWDGRAYALRDQGVDLQISREGGVVTRDLFVVPTDAPNPDAAFAFLKWYAEHPKEEAGWAKKIQYGVASPKAFDYMSKEEAKKFATYPDSLELEVPASVEWNAENRKTVYPRWTDWLGQ
jgi:putative spermidine/putrescine transport system substrate-binding protein